MTSSPLTVTTPDGRTLEGVVDGAAQGPLLVLLHGTPGAHALSPEVVAAGTDLGLRLVAFSRPGYAGSTRRPGRRVADVVPDVLAVVDALGADDFAIAGASGGGPHALACGALAADRCRAVATVAGVGPWDAEGLDFLAGMGEGNDVEFAAALESEDALRTLIGPWREEMLQGGPEGTYATLESVLSPPDRAVFTGEVAARMHQDVSRALASGVDGWVDDDLAFIVPWGFTPADVSAPVFLWQGEQDLMVPPAHGRWLAERLPRCRARVLPDDGHLTILRSRAREVLAELV